MMAPLLRENTHLTVHSKGRMETIAASHITQIRTSRRRRMCDAAALAAADATHLCHNNVAIKHSATMAQIGKFTAASVISVASLPSLHAAAISFTVNVKCDCHAAAAATGSA